MSCAPDKLDSCTAFIARHHVTLVPEGSFDRSKQDQEFWNLTIDTHLPLVKNIVADAICAHDGTAEGAKCLDGEPFTNTTKRAVAKLMCRRKKDERKWHRFNGQAPHGAFQVAAPLRLASSARVQSHDSEFLRKISFAESSAALRHETALRNSDTAVGLLPKAGASSSNPSAGASSSDPPGDGGDADDEDDDDDGGGGGGGASGASADLCLVCNKANPPATPGSSGDPNDPWVQCDGCDRWAHLVCSRLNDESSAYACDTCSAASEALNTWTSLDANNAKVFEWVESNIGKADTQSVAQMYFRREPLYWVHEESTGLTYIFEQPGSQGVRQNKTKVVPFIDTHFKSLWSDKAENKRRELFSHRLAGRAKWPKGFDGGPKLTRYDPTRDDDDQPLIALGSAARQPSVKLGEFSSSMLKLTMRHVGAMPATHGQRAIRGPPPAILPLDPADGGALRFQLPLDSETTAINNLLGRLNFKTMPATDFFDIQSYRSLSDPVPMSIASTAGHVTIRRSASDSQNAVLELDRQASDSLVGLRLRFRADKDYTKALIALGHYELGIAPKAFNYSPPSHSEQLSTLATSLEAEEFYTISQYFMDRQLPRPRLDEPPAAIVGRIQKYCDEYLGRLLFARFQHMRPEATYTAVDANEFEIYLFSDDELTQTGGNSEVLKWGDINVKQNVGASNTTCEIVIHFVWFKIVLISAFDIFLFQKAYVGPGQTGGAEIWQTAMMNNTNGDKVTGPPPYLAWRSSQCSPELL